MYKTFCENCSHFILIWFQPNSFGEMCFLEKNYGNMQKIQILKILRAPSIRHQWVCLKPSLCVVSWSKWILVPVGKKKSLPIYTIDFIYFFFFFFWILDWQDNQKKCILFLIVNFCTPQKDDIYYTWLTVSSGKCHSRLQMLHSPDMRTKIDHHNKLNNFSGITFNKCNIVIN